MCGRFVRYSDTEVLADYFGAEAAELLLEPAYNIAPSSLIPAVRKGDNGRELVKFKWGLLPSWSKTESGGCPARARINCTMYLCLRLFLNPRPPAHQAVTARVRGGYPITPRWDPSCVKLGVGTSSHIPTPIYFTPTHPATRPIRRSLRLPHPRQPDFRPDSRKFLSLLSVGTRALATPLRLFSMTYR